MQKFNLKIKNNSSEKLFNQPIFSPQLYGLNINENSFTDEGDLIIGDVLVSSDCIGSVKYVLEYFLQRADKYQINSFIFINYQIGKLTFCYQKDNLDINSTNVKGKKDEESGKYVKTYCFKAINEYLSILCDIYAGEVIDICFFIGINNSRGLVRQDIFKTVNIKNKTDNTLKDVKIFNCENEDVLISELFDTTPNFKDIELYCLSIRIQEDPNKFLDKQINQILKLTDGYESYFFRSEISVNSFQSGIIEIILKNIDLMNYKNLDLILSNLYPNVKVGFTFYFNA